MLALCDAGYVCVDTIRQQHCRLKNNDLREDQMARVLWVHRHLLSSVQITRLKLRIWPKHVLKQVTLPLQSCSLTFIIREPRC